MSSFGRRVRARQSSPEWGAPPVRSLTCPSLRVNLGVRVWVREALEYRDSIHTEEAHVENGIPWKTTLHTGAAVVVAAAACIAVTAVALSKDGDVRSNGTCNGNANTKIKLSPENGRIQTEFEVDQNRNGVTWDVVLRRNGNVAVSTATTRPPGGSFEVRRLIANGSGPDTISARATGPGGQSAPRTRRSALGSTTTSTGRRPSKPLGCGSRARFPSGARSSSGRCRRASSSKSSPAVSLSRE